MDWSDLRRIRENAPIAAGVRLLVHAIGVVQALLVPVALVVAGLIFALIDPGHDERTVVLRGSGQAVLASLSLDAADPPTEAEARTISEAQVDARRMAARGVLALLLAAAVGLVVLLGALEGLRRRIAARLAARVVTTVRRQLHRQMYRLGQSALPAEGLGPVVDLFTREVDQLREGLRAHFEGTWRWPVLAGLLLILAVLLSWQLTLFLAALAGLVALAARSLIRRGATAVDAADHAVGVQRGLLHEDLGQVRTVRVYGMESVDNRRFDEHLEQLRRAEVELLATSRRSWPGLLMLLGVGLALAVGLIGMNLIDGRLAPATALTLLLTMTALAVPVEGWARTDRRRRRAARAATAIIEFLDRRPELLQNPNAKFLPPLNDRIVLENVTVDAPNGRRLVEGVSLVLPAGSRTAIMGRDDDSKQALVCLLPRLLDPEPGRVRMDGLDLREITLESLRAQIATVFQSDLVFSGTVAENIGLDDPTYDLPRIIEAAKNAHAHHVIQELPQGYDTYVGPLGHYLRIDEQYRIALARAWLRDPSILIIEEPGVPLDEELKPLIDDAVARICQGRTAIFLAHRLSTIRLCDRVVVLHNGRVEAVGPARELQAESKLFRHLQYLEFNQFASGGIEAGQMQA